jgi:hypothetical protein
MGWAEAATRRQRAMVRILTFDGGAQGQAHFTQLWQSFLTGAMLKFEEPDQQRGMKKGKSLEDRRRERAIVKALKTVSVDHLDDDTGKPLVLLVTGEPSRVLMEGGGTITLSQPDWEYLRECVECRFIQTKPTSQESYLDMVDFVSAADKIDEDTPPAKPKAD